MSLSEAFSQADEFHMRRALELARRGWGQVAPNPLVGAVIVRDGEIVGEGHHARYGAAHAERAALAAAGERARGATAYVTLEPCAHHGKTPPCVDALVAAGVSRVVAAVADPNPLASGGATRLSASGVVVQIGLLADDARELNAPFFHALTSDRPWVTLKLALTLDAAVAPARGARRWLTGEESRAAVHRMRAGVDAVAVGIGTALEDDPALTVRAATPPRVEPVRVVFDRHARLPPASVLARTARDVPTIVVAGDDPDEGRVHALTAQGVVVATAASLHDGLRGLRARGVLAILVEGGPTLAASLLAERLADRLVIFHAPVLLGTGAVPAFGGISPTVADALGRLALLGAERVGTDVMTTYAFR